MNVLASKKCEVCEIGAPLLTHEEIDELMPQLKNWIIIETDGVRHLSRTFRFNNFKEALSFTNKVGTLAELEGHHPSITTERGQVTVCWWSRKIKDLHLNDFIMASKTDTLTQPAHEDNAIKNKYRQGLGLGLNFW
jgi:4a-hydroxytetrahydrobiopterin dehydratase